jgi:hypothetical protein
MHVSVALLAVVVSDHVFLKQDFALTARRVLTMLAIAASASPSSS